MLNQGWLTEEQADKWFGITEDNKTETQQSAEPAKDVEPKKRPAFEEIYPAAR